MIPPPNTKTNIADSTDDETIRAEDLLNNNATPDYLMNINNDRKPAAVVNLKTYSTSKPKYMDSYASVQPNCDVNNIIERVDFSIEEIFNSIDNKNIEINEIENDQKNSAANSIPQILLEGVADRDWGIAFSVVNGRINKQKLFSDLLFYKK